MQRKQIFLLILLLTPTIFAEAVLEPDYSPHADTESLKLGPVELEDRQLAAGGGIAATTLAASQYPTTIYGPELLTVDGTTTTTWTMYTQTFAATALGSWDLGATPRVGSIGLGSIQGTVGEVKTKRAIETPVPVV